MLVKINNFGDILISRPAGKEAFLMAKAYVFKELALKDDIILDFNEIKVLTPSWVDEFISGIKSEYKNPIQYINTENPSVKASLKTVLSE
ncbi:hypothetical protein TREPR_1876 [Treponema primitia ZAS-2]|uniref:DUF4325 domain-containing protein n=1 Tax=Treponema primitia (strain ATCC BAA-887 / DSM 12427 / ZAS-2) TaxID=545694 RepID=F5YL54_TREPZ|nr:DUF4325 domain-containing protein [Treponema primitia]AEF85821.1 hypothetical protein TREPR_1876 [Treponema primitia ZAS-2]